MCWWPQVATELRYLPGSAQDGHSGVVLAAAVLLGCAAWIISSSRQVRWHQLRYRQRRRHRQSSLGWCLSPHLVSWLVSLCADLTPGIRISQLLLFVSSVCRHVPSSVGLSSTGEATTRSSFGA